jgi:hypothetical protein
MIFDDLDLNMLVLISFSSSLDSVVGGLATG